MNGVFFSSQQANDRAIVMRVSLKFVIITFCSLIYKQKHSYNLFIEHVQHIPFIISSASSEIKHFVHGAFILLGAEWEPRQKREHNWKVENVTSVHHEDD